MSDSYEREQEIFAQALGLDPTERPAFLDGACGDDKGLRVQVESLLSAMEKAGEQGFFGQPTSGVEDEGSGSRITEDIRLGEMIGPYRVIEQIGEGGFGRVYRAEQGSPIKREVALKIIKLGMDTKQVISRFETERQALALMDHPSIATVFDAGATERGRPYFVMELVQGMPITEYCDDQMLSIEDRLELFCRVCDAVQHAHQKGIIHRDLKPSNVLVMNQEGNHVPKVIDFGVAKAIDAELDAIFTQTQAQHLVGTPAYMSPEQTGYTEGGIDTRSDVYSLGVLLYELITGVTPIDSETLSKSNFEEMHRLIREMTPPKPSTRLSSNDSSIEIAKHRHSDSRQLLRRVQGDLDWIVMKALEKDRGRRYETVGALADDVQRYLADETVLARPPSKMYTARKFVRRNRGAVFTVASLGLILILGMIGTTWGMLWAFDERERARVLADKELRAQIAANEAAEQAASEAERATLEAQTAEELSRFFVMDVLSSADPARTSDRELSVREALLNASESIEGRFADRPDFEMKIHNALGYLFSRLGVLERAEHHHRREWALTEEEFGAESFESARLMHSIVSDLAMQGRDAEAIDLTQRQLDILEKIDTPEGAQMRLRSLGNMGALLVRTERVTEAAPILSEVLELKRAQFGDRHPTTLNSAESLAVVLGRIGEHERALELAREAYSGQVEVLGGGDPRTLNSLVNLTLSLGRLGQYGEAQELLRTGIEDAMVRLGEEHPTSIYLRSNYARSLYDDGQFEAAEREVNALIPVVESKDPGMIEQQSRVTLSILASCMIERGAFGEALEVTTRALGSARSAFPEGDARIADFLSAHAGVLTDLQRFEEAETALHEAWRCVDREGAIADQLQPVAEAYVRLYEAWGGVGADARIGDRLNHWASELDRINAD
ncbi:MAG: protein kinase [Phycisphaerales bacterium JB052]